MMESAFAKARGGRSVPTLGTQEGGHAPGAGGAPRVPAPAAPSQTLAVPAALLVAGGEATTAGGVAVRVPPGTLSGATLALPQLAGSCGPPEEVCLRVPRPRRAGVYGAHSTEREGQVTGHLRVELEAEWPLLVAGGRLPLPPHPRLGALEVTWNGALPCVLRLRGGGLTSAWDLFVYTRPLAPAWYRDPLTFPPPAVPAGVREALQDAHAAAGAGGGSAAIARGAASCTAPGTSTTVLLAAADSMQTASAVADALLSAPGAGIEAGSGAGFVSVPVPCEGPTQGVGAPPDEPGSCAQQ